MLQVCIMGIILDGSCNFNLLLSFVICYIVQCMFLCNAIVWMRDLCRAFSVFDSVYMEQMMVAFGQWTWVHLMWAHN